MCIEPTEAPTPEPSVTPTATQSVVTPAATQSVVTPTATQSVVTPTATQSVVTPEPVGTPTSEPTGTPTPETDERTDATTASAETTDPPRASASGRTHTPCIMHLYYYTVLCRHGWCSCHTFKKCVSCSIYILTTVVWDNFLARRISLLPNILYRDAALLHHCRILYIYTVYTQVCCCLDSASYWPWLLPYSSNTTRAR